MAYKGTEKKNVALMLKVVNSGSEATSLSQRVKATNSDDNRANATFRDSSSW